MKSKKQLFLLSIALCISFLSIAQSTRNLSAFDRVAVQEGIYVMMYKGNTHKAEIKASGIDVENVLTDIKDGDLKIHLKGNNHRNVRVEVRLTFKDLRGIEASSGSRIELQSSVSSVGFQLRSSSGSKISLNEQLDVSNLEIDCSSAAYIKVDHLEAEKVSVESSSGGNIDLIKGKAKTLSLDVSSGAKIDASDLECRHVSADASSGGRAKVHATDSIEGEASSGGSVYYLGKPSKQTIRESSGGRVREQ